MLLHYFKNNPNIDTCLATLLDDEQLYAFAIDELTILKNFKYVDKVQKILSEEKVPWRRKVAERYIKKSLNNAFQQYIQCIGVIGNVLDVLLKT